MKEISKKDEGRIIEALEKAVKEANKGAAPDEALVKVAEEYGFQPEIIKRMVAAYNTSKTLSHLKSASDDEKAGSFPIASPEVIIERIFPKEPETPAKQASTLLHPDYLVDDGTEFRSMDKVAKTIELPPMTEKTAEAYNHEDSYASKKAISNHAKIAMMSKKADEGFHHLYFKFLGELDKAAAYWRGTGEKESFELVEKRAAAKFGEPAKTIMTMIHGHGKLDDHRLHVKRADAAELETQQMHFDPYTEPYDKIAGLMFLADEMNRLRKEAAEIRSVMDDHAMSNIHLLPPQPVYNAIDRFLKAAMPFEKQDRPGKTKEIYSAIKKEHPEYSAGKKARIAESANNKVSKAAHVLDDVLAKE